MIDLFIIESCQTIHLQSLNKLYFSWCSAQNQTATRHLYNHDGYSDLYWRGIQQVSRKINIVPDSTQRNSQPINPFKSIELFFFVHPKRFSLND